MRAMIVNRRLPVEKLPLRAEERPVPRPQKKEVLIRVELCGICRTDLHVVEGDLPIHRDPVVPGHQVVGQIQELGPDCSRFRAGDRVGAAWLYSACGSCPYCSRGHENLCETPRFTGYDMDGGYADYLIAEEAFLYPLSGNLSSRQAAPLLCAGIIGYRALCRSGIQKGGRLGLYGFGASAHVVIQIARHWGCEVYVFSRGEKHRALARELGAAWVGDSTDTPPHRLQGAILFAPSGDLVPPALEALDKGAALAIAGIHLTDIPILNYNRHLFQERSVRSVTANTRRDGEDLLRLAGEIPIETHTEVFPLEQANEALRKLKQDGIRGAGVLQISP